MVRVRVAYIRIDQLEDEARADGRRGQERRGREGGEVGGQLGESAGLVGVDVDVRRAVPCRKLVRPARIVRPTYSTGRLLVMRQLSCLGHSARGSRQLTVWANQTCRIILRETDTPDRPPYQNLSVESSFCDEPIVSGALLSGPQA